MRSTVQAQCPPAGMGVKSASMAVGVLVGANKLKKISTIASETTSLNSNFQKGFSSHRELVKYLGPAGKGRAWHHIVEQNPANLKRFGAEKIHNVNNVINVEHGAGKLHNKITGFYGSKAPGGGRIRDWVKNKSFEEQYEFGTKTLERFYNAQ
ncbi:hypothetical protein [uncultured Desulfobacter sp.]|uniref:hypothetical protein n=1 Tax=uncultured Desulfobacter sp. TaxID=240139 RepID=UPI0029F45C1D|nr:hypothetical protein [uncultured Desulfobacter sp.]